MRKVEYTVLPAHATRGKPFIRFRSACKTGKTKIANWLRLRVPRRLTPAGTCLLPGFDIFDIYFLALCRGFYFLFIFVSFAYAVCAYLEGG